LEPRLVIPNFVKHSTAWVNKQSGSIDQCSGFLFRYSKKAIRRGRSIESLALVFGKTSIPSSTKLSYVLNPTWVVHMLVHTGKLHNQRAPVQHTRLGLRQQDSHSHQESSAGGRLTAAAAFDLAPGSCPPPQCASPPTERSDSVALQWPKRSFKKNSEGALSTGSRKQALSTNLCLILKSRGYNKTFGRSSLHKLSERSSLQKLRA
jgi:hypothetical protein